MNRCTRHDDIPQLQTARTRQQWLIALLSLRPDPTDEETDALARLLRDAIEADHYQPLLFVSLIKVSRLACG